MKYLSFLFLFVFVHTTVNASDTLLVQLNKQHFNRLDTIQINCIWNTTNADFKNETLHVILENTNKNSRSAFRYPLINNECSANLIIGEDIPEGNYAMHFFVQKAFPQLEGKINNFNIKTRTISYMTLLKNKAAYFGTANVDLGGHFRTSKFAFPDSANFIFFEIGKKNSDLDIQIKNNLDSLFDPINLTSIYITLGNPSKIDTGYRFVYNEKIDNKKNTLETVIVKSKIKKKIELFNEQYSSGLFNGGSPTIFDGIEDESISRSFDIFTFIQSRIAGITKKDNQLGIPTLHWRNQPVSIYLDEFKIDDDYIGMLNTSDIAMIKVFAPFSGGPTINGCIAIYTRRGNYELPNKRKFNFLIKGFNQLEGYWHL